MGATPPSASSSALIVAASFDAATASYSEARIRNHGDKYQSVFEQFLGCPDGTAMFQLHCRFFGVASNQRVPFRRLIEPHTDPREANWEWLLRRCPDVNGDRGDKSSVAPKQKSIEDIGLIDCGEPFLTTWSMVIQLPMPSGVISWASRVEGMESAATADTELKSINVQTALAGACLVAGSSHRGHTISTRCG